MCLNDLFLLMWDAYGVSEVFFGLLGLALVLAPNVNDRLRLRPCRGASSAVGERHAPGK